MNLSFTQNKVDLRHLPNEYVTKKFYDLAYQVDYYDINNAYNGGCPVVVRVVRSVRKNAVGGCLIRVSFIASTVVILGRP